MGTCAACSDHLMSQLEGEGGGGGVGKGVVGGNGYLCSDHLMSQLEGEGGGGVKGVVGEMRKNVISEGDVGGGGGKGIGVARRR